MTANPGKPHRRPGMAAGEFWVVMCAACDHPGGLHVIDQWEPRATHCRCCADCPLYADGEYGIWSDARTREVIPDWGTPLPSVKPGRPRRREALNWPRNSRRGDVLPGWDSQPGQTPAPESPRN